MYATEVMKKILTMFAFAAIVAGCNNNANQTAKINEDSIRIAQDKARLDSFERAEATEKAVAAALAKEKAQTQNRTTTTRRTTTASSAAPPNYYVTPAPQQPEKQGWSSAAKGAVIGGVAGAATGILVDKKDGRGAVIGGVVGAGTGYAIGRSKDKKTGRAQ